MNDEALRQVDALLRSLEAAWRALDFDGIRALWVRDQEPVYIAEEAAPHLDWASLERYWAHTRTLVERMYLRIDAPAVRPLAEDHLSLVYDMHWEAHLRGELRPVGGDNRVCAVVRHTPAGPRFVQYVEAPLAPILYMRRLYERAAGEGLK
jgi:hypothetical protein